MFLEGTFGCKYLCFEPTIVGKLFTIIVRNDYTFQLTEEEEISSKVRFWLFKAKLSYGGPGSDP